MIAIPAIAQTPADNTKVNTRDRAKGAVTADQQKENAGDRDIAYEGRVKNGDVLLSVHCDTSDEITRAKEILKRTGAEDIASTGEKSVGDYATTASDARKM